jgi:hypothetical protein
MLCAPLNQAFAYGGHNVILEIQATLPSPPPTLEPYMRGVAMLPHMMDARCQNAWATCYVV